jgi:glycosyltransferase involved in cell wall biosynthesis
MRPVRVVYVIGALGRGGAEKQLYLLLKYLDRDDVDPSVISLSPDGPWAESIRALGIPVIELRRRRSFEVARLLTLRRLLRERRPDIVQTFLFSDNVYGLLAARWAGVPVLVASRRIDQYGDRRGLLLRLNRVVTGWASAVICNAESSLAHVPPALRAHHVVIRNGTEIASAVRSRLDVRRELGIPPEALAVGTAGRMVRGKNHQRFVEVAAPIVRARRDVYFVLAGRGPEEAAVRARIAALGIGDRVLLVGERSDVPDLLGALDVFLLTSDREGLSNATMEAMAAGLPCVVTNAGGNRELVLDGETGFVCASNQAAELGQRLGALLADAGLREAFGARGRRRIETAFSPAIMAAATAALYRTLVEGRSRPSLIAGMAAASPRW